MAPVGAPTTSTEQRGSARRCRVCSDSDDSNSSRARSGAVAGVTREAKGCPANEVASVPDRAARNSFRAAQAGASSGASCGAFSGASSGAPSATATMWTI